MKKSDWVRLQHIQQAINELVEIIRNRSREDLNTDRLFMLSVIKLVEHGTTKRSLPPNNPKPHKRTNIQQRLKPPPIR